MSESRQDATGGPPALYARWHRVDTGPGTPDEMIAENWRVAFKEEREFWRELDADLSYEPGSVDIPPGERDVAEFALAARQPQAAPGEVRTCYCGTTATVVPGAFPHPDCDGSVRVKPRPVAALASLADEMDREAAALRAAGAQLGGHGREVREYAALAHEDDARRVRKLTAREPGPVARTPALARPGLGAVLVLAVGTGADDSSVLALEKAVKGATEGEGVTVVTVRGVEALRTWEPQPAPGLAHTREDVIASYNAGYVAAVEKHGAPGLAAAKADAEQARDALSAVMTENRQRRELLGEIGALAANADDDENCFAVCEEIAMRIAAAGVPDGGLPS